MTRCAASWRSTGRTSASRSRTRARRRSDRATTRPSTTCSALRSSPSGSTRGGSWTGRASGTRSSRGTAGRSSGGTKSRSRGCPASFPRPSCRRRTVSPPRCSWPSTSGRGGASGPASACTSRTPRGRTSAIRTMMPTGTAPARCTAGTTSRGTTWPSPRSRAAVSSARSSPLLAKSTGGTQYGGLNRPGIMQ